KTFPRYNCVPVANKGIGPQDCKIWPTPAPSGPQFVPSQRAMLVAAVPPTDEKDPAMKISFPCATSEGIQPASPPALETQFVPSHRWTSFPCNPVTSLVNQPATYKLGPSAAMPATWSSPCSNMVEFVPSQRRR